MYEKKLTVKEHVNIAFKTFSFINSASRFALFTQILSHIFEALIPSVIIFMSAKIIDLIVDKANEKTILLFAFYTVCIEFLFVILRAVFSKIFNQMKVRVLAEQDLALQEKAFSLSFEQISDSNINEKRKQIENNSESGLGGIFEAIWFSSNFFRSGFHFVIAFLIIVPLLIKAEIWMSGLLILFVIVSAVFLAQNYKKVMQVVRKLFVFLGKNAQFYDFYLVNYIDDEHAAKEIRVLQQQDFLNDELKTIMYDPHFSARKNQIRTEGKHKVLTVAFTAILGAIVYLFVAVLANKKVLSLGDVLKYYLAITQATAALAQVVVAIFALLDNNYYLKLFFDYLNLPNEIATTKNILTVKTTSSEFKLETITLHDVCYKYPSSERNIVNNLSLTINKGERLAIVGLNGSGKTTLIKLICGLLTPNIGKIFYDNVDSKNFSQDAILKNISAVFQDFKLLPFTIGEIVAGSKNYDEYKVWDALEKAGVADRIKKLPHGLNQFLSKDFSSVGVELSGGETQKLAIARAIYKDAQVMILDEPTASLDIIAESEIYESFNRITQDKTVIFISHRLASCKFCDRIIVMDEGKIAEIGTHQSLLGNPNSIYAKMWNAECAIV